MTVEENNDDFTTIQISKKVHKILKDKKIIKREPFNNVIKRLIEEEKENE